MQPEEGNNEDENILDRAEIEDEEEEEEETYVTQRVESEFDFNSFVQRFAVKSVCAAYTILFATYDKNSDHTNHCVIKMFHRIAFDLKLPALLFHVQILRVSQRIHKDYRLNPANSTIRDMNRFAKFLLQKMFEVSQTNKHLWMEICFWKTSREASEIVDGYGTQASSKKQKASFWCEEDEEKLTRVFHQLQEMQEKQPEESGGDMLDSITDFFENSGKSRRQVAQKLKQMALITDIRQVTKKPLKTKAAPWTDEEIETLTRLYKEFEDAVDPVKRIIDQLPVKRQKKRIVEKIMELGLCDDKKKLMKKKIRRGLKEGDAGYLEKASGSDSAMEDSSSDDDEADNNQASDGGNDNNSGGESFDETELKSTLEAISKDENLLPALKWLKTCLNDEKEDREEDDENIADMPLVPILEECTSAMELPDFVKLLSVTKLSAPNDQEQYWRIPATLSAKALAEKCTFIQNIIDMEIDDINLEAILGKSGKKTFSKTKKKEKRGPNKWMPVRRAVDSEVAQRISEAAGVKEKEASPPPESGKKKSGKSKKKPEKSGGKKKTPNRRKIVKNDSSSGEENNAKEKGSDSGGGDDDGNKKTPNRRKMVKFDSSSDEENNAIEKGSDSGDDDGNNASSEQQVNSPVFKSAQLIENSSSDDEENQTPSRGKSRENKAKRRVMNSSSSDEAVDDPSPMPSQNVRIF